MDIGAIAGQARAQGSHRVLLVIEVGNVLGDNGAESPLPQTRCHLHAGRGEHVGLEHVSESGHQTNTHKDHRYVEHLATHFVIVAIGEDTEEVAEEETPQGEGGSVHYGGNTAHHYEAPFRRVEFHQLGEGYFGCWGFLGLLLLATLRGS